MNKPLISIIMSIYNETLCELSACLKSLLNQTYSNIEIIIVNDNPSSDVNKTFLSKISDKRVRIVENDHNIGLVASLNKAISLCNGGYIARMDADDISHNDRIEKQIDYMLTNNIDVLGCNVNTIDENDAIISTIKYPKEYSAVRKFIKYASPAAHPTWLVKKEVYDSLNGYRNVPLCEDYDFLVRAMREKYRISNIGETLFDYRVRKASISNLNQQKQAVLQYYISLFINKKEYVTEQNIRIYMESKDFLKDVIKYDKALNYMKALKMKKLYVLLYPGLWFNRFFFFKMKQRSILKKYL